MITGKGIIDFGAFPGNGYATATVTGIPASQVKTGQQIHVWAGQEATPDHTIDEHRVESIRFSADTIVENTSFRVVAVDSDPRFNRDGKRSAPLYGVWSFSFMYQ